MGQINIKIEKFNGDIEEFKVEKLKTSLRRSKASENEIDQVVNKIMPTLYDGMKSKEIYKTAYSILKKLNRVSASKYSLKRAILDLGPTGFPFESLIGAVLKHHGYTTQVGITLQGECITHEVDVLAEKDGNAYTVECKFHTDPRAVSNVKIPLYINSRFLDIQRRWNNDPEKKSHLKQGWLVTNTRFSKDAIDYSKCVGLHLMSWDYPDNNGIKHNIDKYTLYPITTLTTLTKKEKHLLIEKNVILTKELYESSFLLEKIGLSQIRQKRVLSEIKKLCNL
ncbi:ATP cone domain-containing protein [Aequorivita sediminis]|uniref:ATP cone domain-containing protein n=1 Tax=Aequorivita sediminis TaxID=3073653 RepID=UPI0028A9D9F5|nr:ATP cone domain-containing protein [Aequorivita sp. F6058]